MPTYINGKPIGSTGETVDIDTSNFSNFNGDNIQEVFSEIDEQISTINEDISTIVITAIVAISVADWDAGTSVVKTVDGVTATNLIWVAPSPDSYSKCAEFEIRASAQGIDQLTFIATSTPDAEVVMNVVIGADQ